MTTNSTEVAKLALLLLVLVTVGFLGFFGHSKLQNIKQELAGRIGAVEASVKDDNDGESKVHLP